MARADVVVGDAAAAKVLLRREFARYVVLERCRRCNSLQVCVRYCESEGARVSCSGPRSGQTANRSILPGGFQRVVTLTYFERGRDNRYRLDTPHSTSVSNIRHEDCLHT